MKSLCLTLLCGAAAFAQVTIPPGTGAAHSVFAGFDTDQNWSVAYADIAGEIPPGVPEVAARAITTKRGGGWFTPSTGTWIGPDSDQSNATRGAGFPGTTTFQLEFNVNSPSQAFNIFFCADDYTDVRLNGNVIYDKTDSIFASCKTLTVTSGFQNGQNLLHFNVTNVTGPTGLYVLFSAVTTGSGPTLGINTSPRQYSAVATPDPVDGATGQYWDEVTDLSLGGPMNLAFRRYYSSQLSNGKITSALGTNWMSNFDAMAVVADSTAQVLLERGLIVSFAKSGGAWQLVSPKDIVYQFQQTSSGSQLMDPTTRLVYTFNASGKLTSIADRNSNTITVTQGANGPTQISDGVGRTLSLTYTGSNLTKVTDQANRSVSFAYTSGLLTSATDYFNLATKYAYTAGFLTAKTLPLGNVPTTQTYDAQGRVTSQTIPDASGGKHTITIAYDAIGGTTITDPSGNVTKQVSANGELTQISDPAGGTAIVSYDGSERRTNITDKLGKSTSYAYAPETGLLASVTNTLGNTIKYTYTPQASGGFTYYDMTRADFADGTFAARAVDARGNALTFTDRNGAATKSTYDAAGRVLSIARPGNQTSTMTWNSDGTMASLTDAMGNQTTFGYDATKRMTSRTDPYGKTSYVLDQSTTGPMVAINPPVKGEGATIYDDQNRQLQDVVNAFGSAYHYDYTPTGKLAASTDPQKRKSTYTYDGSDRLSTITNGAGEKKTYAYDAINRVTSIADANGTIQSFTYTPEGQVASVTDGAGRKTIYAYDAFGELTTVTTPAGHVYMATYDKNGVMASVKNPLGDTTTYTRDNAGVVKSVTAAGGVTASRTIDASGQVTAITSANGNTWNFSYDADGRLTKLTDPLGQAVALTYTGLDLTKATLPLGTVTLANDADGRVTQQNFSDGLTINNTYDANGVLTATNGVTITRNSMGLATNINGIAIAYDNAPRVQSLTYATNKAITYGYDSSGLLTSVTDWVGGKTTLRYDASGVLTAIVYPNGVTTAITVDGDGAVTKLAYGSLGSINITRDAAGKITGDDRNLPVAPVLAAGSQQYTFDAAGQVANASYDLMGRVTTQNGRTYKWNLASQLTSFKDGVNNVAFTYDGLGGLSASTASGAPQVFVYNYLFDYPALSIVRQSTGDYRYYVYLPDGRLLYSIEASNNARHYFHFDEMGNTAFLTDDSGAVSDSYGITPYGEVAVHMGTSDNPFLWQGEFGVMQTGTNLYYMRDRFYDATSARFLSRDPEITASPLESEPYAYAGGNPMLFIDPLGNNFFSWVGDGLKAAGNAISSAAKKAADAAAAAAAATAKALQDAKNKLFPPPPPAKPSTPVVAVKKPTPVPSKQPALTVPTAKSTLGSTQLDPSFVLPSSGPAPSSTQKNLAPALAQRTHYSLNLVGDLIKVEYDSNGNEVDVPVLVDAKGRLIGQDGNGVISDNSLGIISDNSEGIISDNSEGVVSSDGAGVISNDGGTILVNGTMFVNNHGTLISQDGNNFKISVKLIGQDGNGLIGQDGNGLVPRAGDSGASLTQRGGSFRQ